MADRELRLAGERARSALTGTMTRGRVRYEADCKARGERGDYRTLGRGARVDYELAAQNDPKPRGGDHFAHWRR